MKEKLFNLNSSSFILPPSAFILAFPLPLRAKVAYKWQNTGRNYERKHFDDY